MTAPYYEDDLVTLYLGDCLTDRREWLTADVLITDPPYGIGWKIGDHPKSRSKKHAGIENDQDTSARDRVLADFHPRPAVVFGSFRAPFPRGVKQTLIWQKPADAGVIGSTMGWRTDTEAIFLLGDHLRRTASRSSVLTTQGGSVLYRRDHPHAKPTQVLERLIEWTAGTVADPFAGTGSTLVAAKALGRKSIGVELEERYAEVAARRLSQGAFDLAGVG